MSSHKRSRSATNSGAKSSKAVKTSNNKLAEDLAEANARISELEAQVQELQDYIYGAHVALNAPVTIQEQLAKRPDAAQKMAGQIQAAMYVEYDKLVEQNRKSRRDRTISDDLSEAMDPYLEHIEILWALPGGLNWAFATVMTLGGYSYGDLALDKGDHGVRPSDEAADELLYNMILERKRTDPGYDPTSDLELVQGQAEYLSNYGIEGYFPQSIELLENWDGLTDEADDAASKTSSELKRLYDLSDT